MRRPGDSSVYRRDAPGAALSEAAERIALAISRKLCRHQNKLPNSARWILRTHLPGAGKPTPARSHQIPTDRLSYIFLPRFRAGARSSPSKGAVRVAFASIGAHVVEMPARPFLGVSGEDNRFIVDTLIRHIDPR